MKAENMNLVEAARGVLQAAGYFVDHLWHRSDVQFICEQLEMEALSPEEVGQVFTIAAEQFDGETGISWPQLEKALRSFQQRKAAVRELCPPGAGALW